MSSFRMELFEYCFKELIESAVPVLSSGSWLWPHGRPCWKLLGQQKHTAPEAHGRNVLRAMSGSQYSQQYSPFCHYILWAVSLFIYFLLFGVYWLNLCKQIEILFPLGSIIGFIFFLRIISIQFCLWKGNQNFPYLWQGACREIKEELPPP